MKLPQTFVPTKKDLETKTKELVEGYSKTGLNIEEKEFEKELKYKTYNLSTLEKIKGWAVLNLLPGNVTLGFNKFARWYEENGYYRFKVGEKIYLKDPRIVGYGLNACGWEVKGYTHEGKYVIDANGEEEIHFKWNIDHHFKRA